MIVERLIPHAHAHSIPSRLAKRTKGIFDTPRLEGWGVLMVARNVAMRMEHARFRIRIFMAVAMAGRMWEMLSRSDWQCDWRMGQISSGRLKNERKQNDERQHGTD